MYLGDFTPGAVVRHKFFTEDPTGAPITLAGSAAAKAYRDGSTSTEVTTGVALAVDFDSLTGLHEVSVDTSADGTFYAAAHDFYVILTAGTVNSVSVVGKVLAHFSLANRYAAGGLDAAGVRAAVGLGSANLDTQIGDLPTNAELATALGTADDAVLAAIPSAATTASAVRTELTTELGRIDAAVSTRATPAQVNTEADTALADYDAPTKAEMDAAIAAGDDAVLAAVAALNNLSAAGVRTAVGLASANLDTQLAALAGYLDTEMAATLAAALAVKLQTDKLTFNGSNQLAANIKRVNDVALTGDGTSGTPWGPA